MANEFDDIYTSSRKQPSQPANEFDDIYKTPELAPKRKYSSAFAEDVANHFQRAGCWQMAVIGILSADRTGIRFEITEFTQGAGSDQRFSFTPDLGLYRADIDINGDITLNEQRIRTAMDRHADSPGELRRALNSMLGAQWDAELEPFRIAADGDSVRWVHRVG